MIALAVALLGFHVVWKFVNSLNMTATAVTSFIGLLAYVQLVLAPWLFYTHFQGSEIANIYDLNMQVDPLSYFRYLIPAYIALTLGMKYGSLTIKIPAMPYGLEDLKVVSKWFLGFGLIATVLSAVATIPKEVEFVVILARNLLRGSLITFHILYIQEKAVTQRFLGLVSPYSLILFFLLIKSASSSGMFGEMIFILFAMAVITFQYSKPSWKKHVVFSITGLLFILGVQLTKSSYRDMVWRSGSEASISQLYVSFAESVRDFGDIPNREGFWFNSLSRVNQGFLVSHVISKCENENIVMQGQKTLESIAASVVPRVLWSNKPMAGGRDNIEQFTNKTLVGSTSMNISYFGDFYIDFGLKGAVLALFVFGYFLAKSIGLIVRLATTRSAFFVGLPLILSGIVQVETDLLMIMNHFTKGFIFFSCLDWMMTRSHRVK